MNLIRSVRNQFWRGLSVTRPSSVPVCLSEESMAFSRWSQLTKVSVSAAILSGSYFGYRNYQSKIQPIQQASSIKPDTMELSSMPTITPSQIVHGPTKLKFNLTLFQYCSCPFCCKTRTFLDYFGVKYNIVEVNSVWRQQLKWSPNYKKVPILLAHNNDKVYQINDSSVIISSLGSFLLSKRKLECKDASNLDLSDLAKILVNYQTIEVDDENGTKRKEIPNKYFLMLGDIPGRDLEKRETNLAEERRWRDWADRVLVHSLSPNIYRTMPEAMQAFCNFSMMGDWEKNFSKFERYSAIYLGSTIMWLISKRLKKKYGLKDDVRESLYDNCRLWLKAIGNHRQFLGGDKPNLADLSVFGVLRSIEGCTAFEDLLANTNIRNWYFSVKKNCESHSGTHLVQTI